jgi:hypothetical protein
VQIKKFDDKFQFSFFQPCSGVGYAIDGVSERFDAFN